MCDLPWYKRLISRICGLHRYIEDLKRTVEELSWDAPFGMWTRNAFLSMCDVMPRGTRAVAFLDFRDIHGLNKRLGYQAVDERVKAIFSKPMRKSDLVARWYSGDEIVIAFDSDIHVARKKMEELHRGAAEKNMAFDWAVGEWEVGRMPVAEVVDGLTEEVAAAKLRAGVRRQ